MTNQERDEQTDEDFKDAHVRFLLYLPLMIWLWWTQS